jgi:hypothetical protein
MFSKNRFKQICRLCGTACFFLGWSTQITSLTASPAEADWKLETLQSSPSLWWKTLTIRTVPGVVYHLQKTTSLESGSWINIATTYGTGGEWSCPLFPSGAPTAPPTADALTVPVATANPIQSVSLVLEKTITGEPLISWQSLDDHRPRRQVLAAVTLSAVWDDFDAAYINAHGNYLFGISSRLGAPVSFNSSVHQVGPLDAAMIAAFTLALPAITSNIQNSVKNLANFLPQVAPSTDRAFYRFSANWSVDSDGDGRFDWQEIILDGNNPFAVDSDGDGAPDQTTASATAGNGLPTPTDAQPATPLAEIQQQMTHAIERYGAEIPNNSYVGFCYYNQENLNGPYCPMLRNATSYTAFKAVVESIPYPSDHWTTSISQIFSSIDQTPSSPYSTFYIERSCFRLKLSAPAPEGGYHIPLRLLKIYQSISPETGYPTQMPTPPPSDEPGYLEIQLHVAAGETEGTPVDIPVPNLSHNQKMTYVPTYVTTREKDTYRVINNIVDVNHPISGPIIENGACVIIGESFVADLNFPSDRNFPDLKIQWQKRKLESDGTLGEWTFITMDGYQATPYEGKHLALSFRNAGIYQLQALVIFPNGTKIELPFVRLRDAKSIKDSLKKENMLQKAGAPDFFGVTYDKADQKIRDTAVSWLGSKKYRVDVQVKVDPLALFNPALMGKDKCTLFLLHVANTSDAPVPYYIRYGTVPYAPLARQDWYSNPEEYVDLDAAGWKHGGSERIPTPGAVVAGYGTGRHSGHVGILDYDGTWIGAGPNTVNKHINMQNLGPQYKPFAIRYFDSLYSH